MIKHQYDVWLVGQASCDAKVEMAKDKPVTKFRMWVSSGKNRKSGEFQEAFYFNVKCWGDQAKEVKKGDHVELAGYFTRNEYEKDGQKKTWDEVVVKVNEKKEPMIQFATDAEKSRKHVSDEAIASGVAPTIQRSQSLEITDEDLPF